MRLRRAAAITMCAIMLLATLAVLSASTAESDPVEASEADGTNTVTWEFDDPGDYIASNAVVSDGRATLLHKNDSAVEDSSTDFAAGTLSNINVDRIPGSMVLDATSSKYTTMIQPEPADGEDAHISEGWENDNYGLDKDLRIDSEAGKRYHMLLRFDVSGIPEEAFVDEARLYLYQISGSKGSTLEYTVHSISKSFDVSYVTWRAYDLGLLWETGGGDFGSYMFASGAFEVNQGWWSIDVSKLAENWISGVESNNGMMIIPKPGLSDNVKIFQSADQTGNPQNCPKLVVNYTLQGSIGAYESQVMGPGTDAVFTLSQWSNGTGSFLTDEFAGTSLASKWTWFNNPEGGGGAYDVGVTSPGYLHIEGEVETRNLDGAIDSNYLSQHVTNEFEAVTYLRDSFTTSDMGAGILVVENATEWISIEKVGPSASAYVRAIVTEEGVSTIAASMDWSGHSDAYLKVVRSMTTINMYVSSDGTSYALIYSHVPASHLMVRLHTGLFVYSDSPITPVVEFGYFRVTPPTPTSMEVRIRTGNSTDLSDPSWEAWGDALPGIDSHVIGEVAHYVQYRIFIRTTSEWYSPALHMFRCHYELYSSIGSVETPDFVPADFGSWLYISTAEEAESGTVRYWYSFNSGSDWHYAGSGGLYSIASTIPSLRVRVEIESFDTLTTPAVDRVSAKYARALGSFYVQAPSQVVAGEPFEMVAYAKDSSNVTIVPWTGAIMLTAMNQAGTSPASTSLETSSAIISAGGYVTIPQQEYRVAETIRIRAYSESSGVSGLSGTIQVLPGPTVSLGISPAVNELVEHTSTQFTAAAYDEFNNVVPVTSFSWTADATIGVLSSSTGTSVTLITGNYGASGHLNVTADGVTESRLITVKRAEHVPQFTDDIPPQYRDEDSGSWSLDLTDYVDDEYHLPADLRWYVTGEELVRVSGENRTGNLLMTLTPEADVWGHEELNLFVVDSEGMSGSTTVNVTINPVNDAPVIDLINPLVVKFDMVYIYNMKYHLTDVDNGYDELTMTVNPASIPYVDVERLTLAINYPESLNGTTQYVEVTVTDGDLSGSTTITVTVSDDEVPVVSDSLPSVEIYQGLNAVNVFDLDDYFIDPDDDILFYTYGQKHVTVTIGPDNKVSFYAGYEWYGVEYIIFSAVDPRGARVESLCEVTVIPVNQPPSIGGVPDLTVKYDERFEFDLARYITDPDDETDALHIQTDCVFIAVTGSVLSMLFPWSELGEIFDVRVTVADEEFSDSCQVLINVTSNSPPRALALPEHSFYEDAPLSYPSGSHLEEFFEDEDWEDLVFEVFPWTPELVTTPVVNHLGEWSVRFAPTPHYNGITAFTVRALDPQGALTEATVELRIMAVPDPPEIDINDTLFLEVGERIPFDLTSYVSDVDTPITSLRFSVAGTGSEYVMVMVGTLVLEFPDDFVENGGETRSVDIVVIVIDPDGLTDSDVLTVSVYKGKLALEDNPIFYVGLMAAAGTAAGLSFFVMRSRKRPFVIRDMMLVHNDGFLIGRAAEKQEGEIDEDIMSGMLTAVLNFVEDSMATSQDTLKSFGFKEYQILVHRGKMTYAAVVYEGEPSEDMEFELEEFLAKTERIYRKRIENWTGDMDVDFAGVEVLLRTFVDKHSRKPFANGAKADEQSGELAESPLKPELEPEPEPPEPEEELIAE